MSFLILLFILVYPRISSSVTFCEIKKRFFFWGGGLYLFSVLGLRCTIFCYQRVNRGLDDRMVCRV